MGKKELNGGAENDKEKELESNDEGTGDGDEGGGATGDEDSSDDGDGDGNASGAGDTVKKSDYERMKADMLKFKKQARDLEKKDKDAQLKALKEKQDWQKIAQLKEKEANEEKEKNNRLLGSIISDKKISAIRTAAIKEGLLDSASDDLELISWDDVEVETTSTGRINVHGAEDAVKKLKSLKPHWFGKPGAKFNGKIPGAKEGDGEGLVSIEKLNKLEKEAKESGDYSAYEKAFKTFQRQLEKK